MSKKRPLVFSRAGLRGLLQVSLRGATLALAEKTDPTARELSVHGRWGMLGGNGGSWAVDPLGPPNRPGTRVGKGFYGINMLP